MSGDGKFDMNLDVLTISTVIIALNFIAQCHPLQKIAKISLLRTFDLVKLQSKFLTILFQIILFMLNPLYTGGLFHCYMMDKYICHFRVVRSI